ncbi:hypothetical protein ACM66B_007126 [Microbotryomycetes sp. NB124-2]
MTAADSSPPGSGGPARQLAILGHHQTRQPASRDGTQSSSQAAGAAAVDALGRSRVATALGHIPPVAFVARAVVKVVLSSLIGLLITVSVFVIMYRKPILYILFGDDKPPTLTEINTEKNRSPDGHGRATGFDYRRRQVLRNRFAVHSDEEDDQEQQSASSVVKQGAALSDATGGPPQFKVVSKPPSLDIKSCMRQTISSPSRSKSVRLVDSDELDTLEALRQFWAAPPTDGTAGIFHPPKGGIAGYRRTRDIYMRGQAAPRSSRSKESNGGDSTETTRAETDTSNGGDTVTSSVVPRIKTTVSHSQHLGERTSSPAGSPRLGYSRASSPPNVTSTLVSKGSSLRSGSPHPTAAAVQRSSARGGGSTLSSASGRGAKRRTPSVSPGPGSTRGVTTSLDQTGKSGQGSNGVDEIVLPRWVKPKSTRLATRTLTSVSSDAVVEDDGFEDCSDRSGASTPTGLGETLTPFTKLEIN